MNPTPDRDQLLGWLRALAPVPGVHVAAWRQERRDGGAGMPGRALALDSEADLHAETDRLADLAATTDVYLRVTTAATPPDRGSRGGNRDTHALWALWSDLDHGEGCHQPNADGLPLPPDRAAALSILDGLPQPTVVVDSSGGLYAWWVLERPVTVDERDDLDQIAHRWSDLLVQRGAERGWHVDPVRDLARVLRPPGTLNHKWPRAGRGDARPVLLYGDRGPRHRLEDLLGLLPAEPAPLPFVTPASGDHADLDAWADATSWAEILEPYGWRHLRSHPDGSTDWTRPGDPDQPRSATTDHDGIPTMMVWSDNAGLPSGAGTKLTKFRVYAHLHHRGDHAAASAAIRQRWAPPVPPTTVLGGGAQPEGGEQLDQHEQLVEQETARLLAREEARRRVAAMQADGHAMPQLVGLDDFLDQPDPEVAYRIEGLWPADGRVLFAAQYKAGKTTSVGNVLRALADGGPLFGTFPVVPPGGRIILIDDELHENTLRRWLRGQGIVNTDRISLVALRGKLSTFDLLDETVRQRWAEQIAEADGAVVILDCLRPIIDALGLSEDKDTGQVLTAFDELLDRAGVSEGMIVHHMGHTGERSRGDSRLRDWPDAEWKIVRQRADDGEDDPAAPRYFSAFGRDVEVSEQQLGLADDGRRLYIAGGSRRESTELALRDAVVKAVTDVPGMTATDLRKVVRDAVGGQSAAVDKGRDRAVADGLVEVRIEGRSKLHYPRLSNVSDRVQDAWTDSGGERVHVPIGGTGHVTTPSGPDANPRPVGHGHGPELWACPDCGKKWRDPYCPLCEAGQEGAA